MAVVRFVINIAVGRTLAVRHGYNVDPNQVKKKNTLGSGLQQFPGFLL